MSSGKFTLSRYETNDGDIAPCRVQEETITAWNAAPTGAVTVPVSANMGGSRRRNGINARYASGRWVDDVAPAGYLGTGRVRVPILTPAAFAAIQRGDELAYLGATFVVTGKVNEAIV